MLDRRRSNDWRTLLRSVERRAYLNKKVIVIINDNNKSISDNVGFINDYLKIVRKYGNEISIPNIET
ncbi:MAG: hypothetical protein K2O08_03445, partial [Clostridia bacterium]|nr:hypothetical protein [Clostridia bacterium]